MISVANRIYVHPDYAEAFEKRFRERAGLVDQMPGFVFNQVLRPTTPDDPYVVLTYWKSYEQFRAWVESEAFKEGHAKSGSLPPEAFTKRNQLEIHQIVMDSRDPDLMPDEPLEITSFH